MSVLSWLLSRNCFIISEVNSTFFDCTLFRKIPSSGRKFASYFIWTKLSLFLNCPIIAIFPFCRKIIESYAILRLSAPSKINILFKKHNFLFTSWFFCFWRTRRRLRGISFRKGIPNFVLLVYVSDVMKN